MWEQKGKIVEFDNNFFFYRIDLFKGRIKENYMRLPKDLIINTSIYSMNNIRKNDQ